MPEAQGTAALENGWSFPVGPLGELTAAAELRARALAPAAVALERDARVAPPVESFAGALARGRTVAVIAELKRRSPSKGVINETLDVRERATEYEAAGAAALSVLTEPARFGGSLDDLRLARATVRLPLLRKDFIVSRLQLAEARVSGASAVLLIARALAPARRAALAAEALELGLDVLLEVRDEPELELALRVERAVIGINNRNLETLVIDHSVSARLLPLVPAHRTVVYESGVTSRADVERAAALGADAVLVGSALSSAGDGGAAAALLTGVPRRARG
ncbi:MAG: indole-3-glycerol phosphate synthase TrpC [Gemmatimonadaceae bacterium]